VFVSLVQVLVAELVFGFVMGGDVYLLELGLFLVYVSYVVMLLGHLVVML